MSNTNPSSVTINSTMATLTHQTETGLNLNTTLSTPFKNSTLIPHNNTSWYPNTNISTNGNSPWYFNNTNYWNNSIYHPPVCSPYCPNYVTIDPPLITYSYTYSYAYYVLLLLLLIVAIICIKIGISRRRELERRAAIQRRRALQQSQNAYVAPTNNENNSNNDNNNNTDGKVFDLPPAYDDVVQSYILAKQLEQQSTGNSLNDVATGMTATNPSSNTISAAISTLTIETEISNSNHASAMNLNNASTSSIMSETNVNTSAVVDPSTSSTSAQPPSYDHLELEMSTTKLNNDHIV